MSANSIEIGAATRLVAARVKTLRRARGWRLEDLSVRLGEVGRPMLATTLSKVERCARRIDVDDVAALAAAFRVPVVRLLEAEACEQCHGAPPLGFTCNGCGLEAR